MLSEWHRSKGCSLNEWRTARYGGNAQRMALPKEWEVRWGSNPQGLGICLIDNHCQRTSIEGLRELLRIVAHHTRVEDFLCKLLCAVGVEGGTLAVMTIAKLAPFATGGFGEIVVAATWHINNNIWVFDYVGNTLDALDDGSPVALDNADWLDDVFVFDIIE